MTVNKNFVVKNGFEVSTNLILANATTKRVGINTLVPRVALDVRGGIAATDISASGIGTIVTFNSTNATVTNISGTGNLNYSGIGTITTFNSTNATVTNISGTGNLNYSGIGTISNVKIDNGTISAVSGVVTYYGDGSQLTNINLLGLPAGSNTQVQYNNAGLTSGSPNFTFNGRDVRITGIVTASSFIGVGAGASVNQFRSVGVSTFTNGPVLVGGATSTGTSGQVLQVSGINSSVYVGGSVGVGTTTTGTTNPFLYVNGNAYLAGVSTVLSSNLRIRNPANTFEYSIVGSAIAANRNLTIPLLTADTGIAVTGLTQTFTAAQTFSSTFTHSATTTNFVASSYTTGTVTIGGASQTGAITVGQATTSQTLNLATGVSGVGTTKTINLGTGGLTGSFTQINVGPSAGVGTVSINSGTNLIVNGNLGVKSNDPTSALFVVGDAKISGIVTAQDFDSLSDINYKTNIEPLSNSLNIVSNLEGVKFVWKESGTPSLGVIAQQIEEYLPELVHTGEHKTVNYNGIIAVLIEAIKELKSDIEHLKDKLN